MPCSWIDVRRYDWLSPENKGRNLGQGGGAYPEMMCNYFWKLNFFSANDAVVVDMSVSQHKGKTIKKKTIADS